MGRELHKLVGSFTGGSAVSVVQTWQESIRDQSVPDGIPVQLVSDVDAVSAVRKVVVKCHHVDVELRECLAEACAVVGAIDENGDEPGAISFHVAADLVDETQRHALSVIPGERQVRPLLGRIGTRRLEERQARRTRFSSLITYDQDATRTAARRCQGLWGTG